MPRLRMLYSFALVSCVGCATPVEVKQATTALDKQYDDNVALISSYRDTLDAMNQLEQSWSRYVQSRVLLNLAIVSTTQQVGDRTRQDASAALLGQPILGWVNQHRLAGVPAEGAFEGGKAKVSELLQGLPQLVALIRAKLDADAAKNAALRDLRPFDDYAKNVAVMKSANGAVKDYLDIDVTVSKDDVKAIADAIEKLRSSK